ncbi:MAG TPA: hypothetical protein VE136_12375 [Anaerolineales bacterium]|nr:hypothetical protein [Anaerolineales bacterium]
MVKVPRLFSAPFVVLILLSLTAWGKSAAFAQEEEPPKRQTTILVPTTGYEWWLVRWAGNHIICQLFVDHEGVPTGEDILAECGQDIFQEWEDTQPCKEVNEKGGNLNKCEGVYFLFIGSKPGEREIVIDLPPPTVLVNLAGCILKPPENICEQLPTLVLSAEEPLPNEHITAIHAIMDGTAINCESATCDIPLSPTPLQGVEIEFWADSSFGDSTQHYTALVRVLDTGVSPTPVGAGWFVDVLSTQWQGPQPDSCAQVWDAFPPLGNPPFWLATPANEDLLASGEPYHYLAGRLIAHGLVDAGDCPGGGLLPNGYANACGVDKAAPMVELWQNQFDPRILNVAQDTNLPAQLLKRLFAQESQFWPGVFRVAKEYGLGQLTDQGADTVLLWNHSFFDQFCPLVLDESVCNLGYLRMEDEERAILRGALAVEVNSDCPECQSGIDLTNADFSIMIFAQSLLANCSQVSRTVFNATNNSPGAVSTYEDLWRFTLANYHAGPGCLAFALYTTEQRREPLDWEHVSTHFTPACQGAVDYVELVTK